MNNIKKVTVNLPAEMVCFLQNTAKKENVTTTDILRRAIETEKFFLDNENINRKILIEDGLRIREVVRK